MQYKLFIAQNSSPLPPYSGIQVFRYSENKRHILAHRKNSYYIYNKGLKPTFTPLKNY